MGRIDIERIKVFADEHPHLSITAIAKLFGCTQAGIGAAMRRKGYTRIRNNRKPIRLDVTPDLFVDYRGVEPSIKQMAAELGIRRETMRRKIMRSTEVYWRSMPKIWVAMPRSPDEVKLYHAIFEEGVAMSIPELKTATGVTPIVIRGYLDYCKAFSAHFKQLCDSGIARDLAIEQTHNKFSPGVRSY